MFFLNFHKNFEALLFCYALESFNSSYDFRDAFAFNNIF
jgi:hypothetical protein